MGGDVLMLLMRRRSFVSCSYPCTTKRVVKVSPLKSQYSSLVQLFRKNKEWAAIFYWFLVVRQEDKLQSPLSLESGRSGASIPCPLTSPYHRAASCPILSYWVWGGIRAGFFFFFWAGRAK